MLELAKIETMYYYFNGNKAKALNTITAALKKAIRDDLAISALEITIIGETCGLMGNIPRRLISKINEFYKRLQDSLRSSDFKNFNAGFKRRIELIGSFMESIDKHQKQPELLEKSNK